MFWDSNKTLRVVWFNLLAVLPFESRKMSTVDWMCTLYLTCTIRT